jgi:hypothetical protein
VLTGEDERFAYKRARSQLWEMCGERWWKAREGKSVEGEKRKWVGTRVPRMGHVIWGYRRADRGLVPFRTRAELPPKFGWQHAWGMMTWGGKAGDWGKGVEGDKNKNRDSRKEE